MTDAKTPARVANPNLIASYAFLAFMFVAASEMWFDKSITGAELIYLALVAVWAGDVLAILKPKA